jgi:hypothetical protein
MERLGLSEPELKKVVLALPTVLGLSYEDNIKPSLAKLQERLGLREAELKVVLALPSVLGFSYEDNLKPKLDHLQSEVGLTLDALRELVLRDSRVLSASLDASLRPNIVLWRESLAEEGLQLAEVVAKSGPRILRASFEKRTRPRSERAKALGVKASAMVGTAGLADEAFYKRLARAAAEGGRSRGSRSTV